MAFDANGFRVSVIVDNKDNEKFLIFINLNKHFYVKDVVNHIKNTFSFDSNIKLSVNGCTLPEAESVLVIHPGDILNVFHSENFVEREPPIKPNKAAKKKQVLSALDGVGDCLKLLLEKKSELEKRAPQRQDSTPAASEVNVPAKCEDVYSEGFESMMEGGTDGSLVASSSPTRRKRKRTRTKKVPVSQGVNGAAEVSTPIKWDVPNAKTHKVPNGQHIYFDEDEMNCITKSSKTNSCKEESDWKSNLLNLTSKSTDKKIFGRTSALKPEQEESINKAVPVGDINGLAIGGTISFQVLTLSDCGNPVVSQRVIGEVKSVDINKESIWISAFENRDVLETEQWKSLQEINPDLIPTEGGTLLKWKDLIEPMLLT